MSVVLHVEETPCLAYPDKVEEETAVKNAEETSVSPSRGGTFLARPDESVSVVVHVGETPCLVNPERIEEETPCLLEETPCLLGNRDDAETPCLLFLVTEEDAP